MFLAYDTLFNKEVALKVLNFNLPYHKASLITKEIEALSQLRHRNIVKLFDYFPLPQKQQFIVVMQFLRGGELTDLWKSQPKCRFSERKAYHIFK